MSNNDYYSDHLREQQTAECAWHPGHHAQGCPECAAVEDAHLDHMVDVLLEERAFGRD